MDEIKVSENREEKDKKKEMVLEIPNIKKKEESKTEESSFSEEEYKKKQGEFRRKRKRKKHLEKIKSIFCTAFIASIVFFALLIWAVGYDYIGKNITKLITQREVKENSYGTYVERNLEKSFDDLEEEPKNRDFAWDS